MKVFYNQTTEEVLEDLNSSVNGLSSTQAKENQEKYGKNKLIEGKKKSVLQIFLEQFKDFLVIILIIAAAVSGFLGDWESTIVIVAVIVVNAILGTVQTVKAEQSLDSLKSLSAPAAKVLRDGTLVSLPSEEVTVGDIVCLEAGDLIPADGRLIENASLKVNESALTGESVSVEKSLNLIQGDVPLGDQSNMAFSGSFVTYGRGSFVVTNTGMNTEVGKIAQLLKNTSEKRTPLQVNLDQFGQKLSILILVICAILFVINILQGGQVIDAFLFAVALAVAAIPEALSSIVTIVLSFGTQKMVKENAIVRKLQAVEGLGSVSVICSDKTGTLTQNKMTVEHYYINGKTIPADEININDPYQAKLLDFSILCNDSSNEGGTEIGDPTETALINLGTKLDMPAAVVRMSCPRIDEIPFDSDRKLMSTAHEIDGKYTMIIKGAVDVLSKRIDYIQKDGQLIPYTEEEAKELASVNEGFSRNGLRVLAFGYKVLDEPRPLTVEEENHFTFLGLVSMMDPPREESMDAVSQCIQAGIKPVMITGDHKITASAIAKRIGILKEDGEACEGAEIENLSDEELRDFVENISVYARVSPEHKIRIVSAWQEKGNIVAMTGDGVNDAPALKQADIGIAMGITGSEVAKDAAAMVLVDDNFATIVKAVENGRNVYRNIKNAIKFLLSGNFAAILTVLFASLATLPVPFAPVHLLFINLLTDSLPAIALGLEPHSKDVMEQPPRPKNESILTKDFLKKIGIWGVSIGATTIIAFLMGLSVGGAATGTTMAFGTLCMGRLFHGFNCKSDRPLLFTRRFWNNKSLLGAFVIGFVLINGVLLIPGLHSVFKVVELALPQLAAIWLLAFANLPIIQLIQLVSWKMQKRHNTVSLT
ncbi:MAG: calcium-translocating P-type ATPase, PMCA-type [Eubacteriales bacterium]|nr:calcium-translocating P-type ATPase, PMCA-type [Eubacteriales bacterium]